MDTKLVAQENLLRLSDNSYPGRGLIVGRGDKGNLVQVYWIMGRSENSRNRIFSSEGGRIFTEAADPAKVNDPSLIIYNAMDELRLKGSFFAVSNGDQTNDMIAGCHNGRHIVSVLSRRQYEPDAPNFTPRICGGCSPGIGSFAMLAILRRSAWGDTCDRTFYQYSEIAPGFGFCLTTYSGDGNPLPAFRGEPLLMPLNGNMEAIAQTYWSALNEKNRVSLVVKIIEDTAYAKSSVHIINKYKKI